MLSIIIPTLNAGKTLDGTLDALFADTTGLDVEVIVSDGGSDDKTRSIAFRYSATVVQSPPGRGSQLHAGAQQATGAWFLFLHADTRLGPGWDRCASAFIDDAGNDTGAGFFQFALDDTGWRARTLEVLVGLRCRLFRLPYGDQGLLISRRCYEAIGGYKPLPLMEDVDFVNRLGRDNLTRLDAKAVTSPVRYRQDGYIMRSLRNALCIVLYTLGVPVRIVAKVY